ncbi:MAG TPA: guanylate kinase [Cytophagales bacterium]|mgnify:FL=1|jgi:guanylate kinase|nr:guanylate kinase [Cytophagales bacterium]
MSTESGKAVIFSAPSGSGKTTVVHYLLEQIDTLGFSISATTRPPRLSHETHSKDYYFFSAEEFKERIDNHEFIEWEEVYKGAYYGTLKSEIDRLWSKGKHVIFDVDVIGGLNLKKYFGDRAKSFFIKVPDIAILEERLRHRSTENEEQLKRRLEKVEKEMAFEHQFDEVIVNENLEETLYEAKQRVLSFLNS